MKPDRWNEVDEILQSVLEHAPTERRAYVSEVCAGDEQLRRQVLTVLDAYESANGFMETPAIESLEAARTEQQKFEAGDLIGQYRIKRPLGHGGMGEVYLAEHMGQNREVALKILPEHFLADAERVQRFRLEARAVLALNHPNVVTVYDIGETGGVHFISTEFVEGETLRTRSARERLTVSEAVEIATQVAGALAYAHEHGVIHRDVKPENIMLRPDGYVKVLDFGIAKLTERRAANATADNPNDAQTLMKFETSPGMLMGTAHYMSPEQARGKRVDERTDTWSLGCVLYEMLTGRPPFEGETLSDIIGLVLQRNPAPLSALMPDAPAELERIVSKALCKTQDERYQTAKDFLADLRRFKRHYEHESEPEPLLQPPGVSGQMATSVSTGGQQVSATGVEVAANSLTGAGHSAPGPEYIISKIRRHKRSLAVALMGMLLVAVGLGYWFSARRSSNAIQIESIAVLPFVNASGNSDVEYLSDGLTESLITTLSQLPKLNVKARSSVFRYKGKEVTPQQVGKELNVQAIVNGRVVQRGNDLLLHIELVDVKTETALWSVDYNRSMTDLVSLQGEIARDVTTKLQLKLSGADEQKLAKNYTANTEAYRLYLKGNYYLQNKRTEEWLRKSIEYYNQAIEIDPNYALPYAGMSTAYTALGLYYIIQPQEAFAKAKAAAARALELDDNLADAHGAMGVVKLFYEWDWSNCEVEFKRAIELAPNYAATHYQYSQYLVAVGRFDEAIREANRAQELDPLSPVINTTAAWIFYFARDYDEAIKRYKKVIESDPQYFPPHRRLGVAYLQKKMNQEAIAQMQQSEFLSGESVEEKAYLGYAYAVSGQRSEAEKVISELQEQAKRRYVSPYLLALIYVGLDERDRAFVWLEKAYEARSVNLIWLKVEPIFDSLRSDPRFADLLRRIGLP